MSKVFSISGCLLKLILNLSIIMKSFTAICLVGLFAVALSKPSDKYTDKYDNFNIGEILENRRLLEAYVNCLLDLGKCTPEGKELKEHIADALETDCSKCSEKQKTEVRRVMKHLINHEQEFWNKLTTKYDPNKKYVTKHESELKSIAA